MHDTEIIATILKFGEATIRRAIGLGHQPGTWTYTERRDHITLRLACRVCGASVTIRVASKVRWGAHRALLALPCPPTTLEGYADDHP